MLCTILISLVFMASSLLVQVETRPNAQMEISLFSANLVRATMRTEV